MSAVDMYTCPEPDCDFIVGAAGPMGADEYDQFAEEVREHKRRHEPVDSATHASSSQAGLASLITSDGAVTSTPAPSGDTTPALWTDSYGDEHELHPVGTEIVYNGIPDVVGDLDGESAVITGHDLADEVTPYEIRFTRVERMASPDHFWVPRVERSAETTPSLVDLDQREAADRALAALVEWRKAGYVHATVALRKAADEYIEAVSR